MKGIIVEKHFVKFYSHGTFVSERTVKDIDSWDIATAINMARDIVERHNATPYGFQFLTFARGDDDLDSKQTAISPMYFLGGKVETLEEIEARNLPEESILRSNMRCNGYNKVIVNTNSYKITLPFEDDDVVLAWDGK